LNAFTHEEITAYHVKLPSEHLNVAMDVVFDIFFNASFPEDEVEKEGNVICEEIKMYKDNPRAHAVDSVKALLYKKPFGMFIGGTEENVRGMSREQLMKRHGEVYVPSNSILCVVGNNNFDDVVKMAEEMSVDKEGRKIEIPELNFQLLKNDEKREGITQSNLVLGFHFPSLNDTDRYTAEVFSTILGEGMSSKLFSEVRENRGLAYGIKSDLDMGKNYGYMIIWAGTDPGKVEEVKSVCLEEYSKMGEISEEELEAAKIQIIGSRYVESEGSSETAVNLVLEEAAGNGEEYYNYENKIKSVTLDQIKNLASMSEFSSFSLGP